MGAAIEPDRYPDTGFSIKDTPPDLNQMLFERMMAKTGSERMEMGCSMGDSARAIVWSSIPADLPQTVRRRMFFERFYGMTMEECLAGPHLSPSQLVLNRPLV